MLKIEKQRNLKNNILFTVNKHFLTISLVDKQSIRPSEINSVSNAFVIEVLRQLTPLRVGRMSIFVIHLKRTIMRSNDTAKKVPHKGTVYLVHK